MTGEGVGSPVAKGGDARPQTRPWAWAGQDQCVGREDEVEAETGSSHGPF